MFKQPKETVLQVLKEGMMQWLAKLRLSIKRQEIIKKNQKEILQWKSAMTKMKNSLDSLNSQFGLTEERISEFEGPSVEIMLSEKHREKRTKKKMNRASEKGGHH